MRRARGAAGAAACLTLWASALAAQRVLPAPRPGDARPVGAAPTAVSAVAVDAFSVEVAWTQAPGAVEHAVQRASAPTGPFTAVWREARQVPQVPQIPQAPSPAAGGRSLPQPAPPSTVAGSIVVRPSLLKMSIVDETGIGPGASYVYRVVATHPDGAVGISGMATTTTPVPPPVSEIRARPEENGKGVRLEWANPVRTVSRIAAYRVTRDRALLGDAAHQFAPGGPLVPVPMYTDSTLAPGTSARYAVDVVYRLPDGRTVSPAPPAVVDATAGPPAVRRWCPLVLRSLRVTVIATPAFQVTATAADSATGAPVQGMVTIHGGVTGSDPLGRLVSGSTGQALAVLPCMKQSAPTLPLVGTQPAGGTAEVVACTGKVNAPGYVPREFGVQPSMRLTIPTP